MLFLMGSCHPRQRTFVFGSAFLLAVLSFLSILACGFDVEFDYAGSIGQHVVKEDRDLRLLRLKRELANKVAEYRASSPLDDHFLESLLRVNNSVSPAVSTADSSKEIPDGLLSSATPGWYSDAR